jgi:hypothetical protein
VALLIENVPYRIADHPAIVKARAEQREMVKHYLEPEEYARWYRDEPKESTLGDDHIDHVGEWFGRVGGLLEGLRSRRPSSAASRSCSTSAATTSGWASSSGGHGFHTTASS